MALPEIIECYNIAGDYDFMLKILVQDMASYQDFVMNKLSTIENIGNTNSIFVMGKLNTVRHWSFKRLIIYCYELDFGFEKS
ncbi:Lrp/AsnC ligand binding domain-containing protein [Flavobacterium sp. 9]|uniref:Lrp/AsnC ligand binding domain-containing protein n=1 Tax=Flavobacterium sp. 9 TaxID=2035198 RepID=UPI001E5E1735|nr:Lrp/AsnC ligand binding domain-containing protein [Flavobacterium sp. 9]